jgi:hypothetical protein
MYYMDNYSCNKQFCLNNIYNNSDYLQNLSIVKNKLIKKGVIDWENHPEYTQMLRCKEIIGDTFITEELCVNNYKIKNNSKTKNKKFVTISEKNNKKHKHSNNNKMKKLKNSKTKYPKQRCPNGTRRCKISRHCIPFLRH